MTWAGDKCPLSAGQVHQICWEVREGKADPDDVKAMLADFCEGIGAGTRIEPAIFLYLRDAFSAYLCGERTLEAALGLRGKRGARETARERDQKTAAEVLRRLLREDELLEVAALAVAEEFERGKTQVERAWARYKQTALIILRIERSLKNRSFTVREKRRLKEIFKNESWFIDSSEASRANAHRGNTG